MTRGEDVAIVDQRAGTVARFDLIREGLARARVLRFAEGPGIGDDDVRRIRLVERGVVDLDGDGLLGDRAHRPGRDLIDLEPVVRAVDDGLGARADLGRDPAGGQQSAQRREEERGEGELRQLHW